MPRGGKLQMGRARGRARGRDLAQVEARRPGENGRRLVEQLPQQILQQHQQQAVPNAVGIRDANVHKIGSETKPSSESTEALCTEVAKLNIGRTGSEAKSSSEGAEAVCTEVAKLKVGAGRGALRGRLEVLVPVTRPEHLTNKRGRSGTDIVLLSNYFRLVSRPNWRIYHYHVDFSPTIESSRMRRGLLFDHKDTLGACYLFDGMSDLKSLTKLEKEKTELYSTRRTDNEKIRIIIKRVAELAPTHPEVKRLFNTQMRRNLQHLDYVLLGRHFFDQHDVTDIPKHRIELLRGVLTAIHEHETGMMMVVDTIHKVVRKDTVLQLMASIHCRQDGSNFQDNCARELTGCIVMTRYNNRTYRIDDIEWSKNPTHTFETRTEKITFIDYYYKQYDLVIHDRKQPLLICRSKERVVSSQAIKPTIIYLIPELCCMTGLTDEMRSDFQVMKDVGMYTRLGPDKRVQNLLKFIQRVNKNSKINAEMEGWGIKFSDELVEINARVVQTESIIHAKGEQSNYNPATADFSKEMRGKGMFSSASLNNWIVITTQKDVPKAEDFIQHLYRVCPPMGMEVNPPKMITIQNDRTNTYLGAMRSALNKDTQMMVLIVPNNRKDRYDAIKKLACVDMPVPTQVIVARTLTKKQTLMSVSTKIGIQLNCKLGGEAWALEIPLSAPLMVVGFDTFHDSINKRRSVGGFVASLNKTLTRWYSQVAFHDAGGWHELSDNLSILLSNALRRYYSWNGKLPQMILFYRDGVSDGQIAHVVNYEIEQINRTLAAASKEKFRFGFIIVNKRISTRFFSKGPRNSFQNPPPGTVVDHEVTYPGRYDFYLVSQSVRQGTVSPTQYNIIADTSGLSPEHMQRLTYKLTHLYFNWPGTIAVPAPCQYAHKLAYLTGQSLHKDPSDKLADTLYYL